MDNIDARETAMAETECAALLREAAAMIRDRWEAPYDGQLAKFYLAVADWLDLEAPYNQGPNSPARAVAAAYLGRTP